MSKKKDTAKDIANVSILRHPNCVRLLFSFTIAHGCEDYKRNIVNAANDVIRAANEALGKLGHAANGKFEGCVLPQPRR